jgi:rhodanese-related sulfurtransferase
VSRRFRAAVMSSSAARSMSGLVVHRYGGHERMAELPDDGRIVAYCRGAYCVLAHDAVRLLRAHGRDAVRLADGMLERRVAGLPVHD